MVHEIDEINRTATGLAYESQVAREELDKIEFISEEKGIRNSAKNPDTYLEYENQQEIQELLSLFIREVQVNADVATIKYLAGVPTEAHPEGLQSDRIPLG